MKRASLSDLSGTTFDIAVIGGGITGAAIARDAALRGLRVVLVEKEDFASGTSSRSSKLIHGGLRYLETYQFGLVAESVREREMALRLAPHLAKVQPFLYMVYKDSPEKKWLLNLGLTFYDVVSGSGSKRRHKMLSKSDVLERQPQFREDGLLGAAMFYDLSTDDARVTIDTVKGASEHGAQIINHCEVIGLTHDDTRCNGIKVRDRLSGAEGTITASYVVNSTGPWSDTILRFEDETSHVLRPTKGVHIVLRKKDFSLHSAVFMRSPDDGRVVWPIPSMQDDRVFIGTTDTTYDGDLDDVYPEAEDIRYLLNVANHLMPGAKLTEEHIVGSWAGLRPLIAPKADLDNARTPREHQIIRSPSGVFSIVGGKLTSNRIMARHLLDAVVKADRNTYLSPSLLPYSADKVPLSGAHRKGDDRRAGVPRYSRNDLAAELQERGIPPGLAVSWTGRYGNNALALGHLWSQDETMQEDLGARGLTVAELHYCVTQEAAASLRDLLVRRVSAFFWDRTGGTQKIARIAEVMQTLLGWSDEEMARQIEDYRALVAKHRPTPLEASASPQTVVDMAS
ncbi:glycerol-3-phosphate dehydrogenase/oxidase [Thioclava indica]|uniref:Glycerol-3-phosphate dehydrogenase n=1 Tax=Thioclava indica TaxID=1353528 RepID=A0A074JWB7_9RHOB|nr:glycerol-3-phosphate dehydrogenase/oxidase [Thioclava indica]KEO60784.1 hypothetical protein DT23_12525 [Thioclava indica]